MCLLLHLITLNDTHTFGRTPPGEVSARLRELYLKHTTLKTNSHITTGFEPTVPKKRAASDLRLRTRGLCDGRGFVPALCEGRGVVPALCEVCGVVPALKQHTMKTFGGVGTEI